MYALLIVPALLAVAIVVIFIVDGYVQRRERERLDRWMTDRLYASRTRRQAG